METDKEYWNLRVLESASSAGLRGQLRDVCCGLIRSYRGESAAVSGSSRPAVRQKDDYGD